MEKSIKEAETPVDPQYLESAYRHIADMEAYCRPVQCRHRSLVEYFGQQYAADNCGACDLCLGDADPVPDAQTIAKKILSCVYRVRESFGAAHVTAVLRGANTAAIREREHDKLTTYGLLAGHSQSEIRDFIQQLIGQELLVQAGNEYPVLKLNAASWDVMKDRQTARLLAIPQPEAAGTPVGSGRSHGSKAAAASWEGVDREMFERLRGLRLELAAGRGVPPYLIFGDATLRDLARVRPSSLDKMRLTYGVGEAKLRDFGQTVLEAIDAECRSRNLTRDNPNPVATPVAPPPAGPRKMSAGAALAADLFRNGASIDEVMQRLNRARSTTCEYLCDYIRNDRPESIARWVPDKLYHQVADAAARVETGALKPLFVALNEKVPYEILKLVVTHLSITSR
jgi:ATP-dependent DNA helicase RecQ